MSRGGSRSGAGRKRKDPALKELAGTARPDRAGKSVGVEAPIGAMIAPAHLSELAQTHFSAIARILIEQSRGSPHYAEHVALLAQRLEQIQRFQAVIETCGDTYETESAKKIDDETIITRMVRARPEVAMLSDAMRHAQSLLGELMLNPAAALKIIDGHAKEENPFASLDG